MQPFTADYSPSHEGAFGNRNRAGRVKWVLPEYYLYCSEYDGYSRFRQ
jgi:hypothetical protein